MTIIFDLPKTEPKIMFVNNKCNSRVRITNTGLERFAVAHTIRLNLIINSIGHLHTLCAE